MSSKEKAFSFTPSSPANPQDYFDLAWKHYLIDNKDSALYYFQLVEATSPNQPLVQFYIAKIYEKTGDYSSAVSSLTQAIKKEYRKEYWEFMLSLLEEVSAYEELKKVSYYLMEKEGTNNLYYHYFLTSLERSKMKRKDIKFLKQQLPFTENSLNTRAIVLLSEVKEYDKVFEVLDQLIEQNPYDVHFYLLKNSLFQFLDFDQISLQFSEEMLYQFPHNTIVQVNYFLFALQNNQYKDIKRVATEWIKYKPTHEQFYHIMNYMVLSYEGSEELLSCFEHMMKLSFQEFGWNKADQNEFDFLIFAYQNGLKEFYWEIASKYFANPSTTYEQKLFYLNTLYQDKIHRYESELFNLIATYPQQWELYEKAIKFYEEQGRTEDLIEMKEAYYWEKHNSEE